MKSVTLLAAALLAGLATLVCAQAPAANSANSPNTASAPAQPKPMKTWLIRIIPPRPTFDTDAKPDEQALMDMHFSYWKALNNKGVCVFGGPVLDPKGVYGIIVVRAATEDDARALGSADPAVKSGLIKIEVAEMRVAFVPVHQP